MGTGGAMADGGVQGSGGRPGTGGCERVGRKQRFGWPEQRYRWHERQGRCLGQRGSHHTLDGLRLQHHPAGGEREDHGQLDHHHLGHQGLQHAAALRRPEHLGSGRSERESEGPSSRWPRALVLKNVIIGGSGCSAADGVHCEKGSCTLENVWFRRRGRGRHLVQGQRQEPGHDHHRRRRVLGVRQGHPAHNGPGTIKISNFFVSSVGKVYRSCGNCGTQYDRHVILDHVTAKSAKYLAGINANYGDTATFTNITICGGSTDDLRALHRQRHRRRATRHRQRRRREELHLQGTPDITTL